MSRRISQELEEIGIKDWKEKTVENNISNISNLSKFIVKEKQSTKRNANLFKNIAKNLIYSQKSNKK